MRHLHHTDACQLPFQPCGFMALENKGLHSQETALSLQGNRSAAPYPNLLVWTSLWWSLGDPDSQGLWEGWGKTSRVLGTCSVTTGTLKGGGQSLEVRGLNRRMQDGCWMGPAHWVTLMPTPQTQVHISSAVGRPKSPHREGLVFPPAKWPWLDPGY